MDKFGANRWIFLCDQPCNEFAIAHNLFRKKQDQEQKRFLRQSQGEDSRKPIAIRANQAIQRARSRAKAFFKAVARRRQQETHSHPHKPSHPKSKIKSKSVLRQGKRRSLLKFPTSLQPRGKPKKSNMIAKPPKKYAQKPLRAATSLKRNRTAWVVARGKIKRLKSALVSENKGCIYGEKGKS